jgi:hypothetical protein
MTLDVPVIAALVAAVASLLLGVLNYSQALRLARDRGATDKELENLKTELHHIEKKQDARVEYEFEARKRLYSEIEPILYEVSHACEEIFNRVANMAQASRNGNLGALPTSWLRKDTDGYYRRSTVYRLLRPAALYQLTRRRMTQIDQRLDADITIRLELLSLLSDMITLHFRLSSETPSLQYEPYRSNPPLFQGVYSGHADNAALFLCDQFGSEQERVLTFGEFEQAWENKKGVGWDSVGILAALFDDFHPDARPVLWRVLLGTACCSYVLVELAGPDVNDVSASRVRELVNRFAEAPRSKQIFRWYGASRNEPGQVETIDTALSAIGSFIRARVGQRDLLA